MKTAIVFYSFEGNCALAAKTLKEIFTASGKTADILEIKTAEAKKRKGFSKFFWGGSQVLMHKKPALQDFDFDPAAYDLIVLGTPVWAGSPAPAMVSFLDKVKLGENTGSSPRIALFCCHAGGKGKALEKFRALLPSAAIAGEIDFINPAKDSAALTTKLEAWANTL